MVHFEAQSPAIGPAGVLGIDAPSSATTIDASVPTRVQEKGALEMNLKSGWAPLRTRSLATLKTPEPVEVSQIGR
jgi:hypothetical protein